MNQSTWNAINIILDLFSLLMLGIIWFSDGKSKVDMQNKKLFRAMQVMASTCLGANSAIFLFTKINIFTRELCFFASSVYFIAQILFCYMAFLYCMFRFRNKNFTKIRFIDYIYAIPAFIEIILIIFVNPHSGTIFTVDYAGVYRRTPYGFRHNLVYPLIYVILAFVFVVLATFKDKNKRSRQKNTIIIFLFILPLLATTVQLSEKDVIISLIWPTVALVLLILYQVESLYFIERKRVKEAQLEAEIAKNKTAIMMSQIQPHFLYNTLTTIRALIGKDPEQAQDVITAFATYLRTNMDSMNLNSPVFFEKELSHTKTYTSIEQLRFPDLIVEYNIEDSDFRLPALSIQPMVENAIKHGARQRKEGEGKVTVSTYREGSNHVVCIKDNGPGFVSTEPKDNSRSHIGLMNTKKRIEEMMHGEFKIITTSGEGTSVYFIIPDEGEILLQ